MSRACWKCGGTALDGGGYCRVCGADAKYPAREPEQSEKDRRYSGNPGAGSRKRSVVKYQSDG